MTSTTRSATRLVTACVVTIIACCGADPVLGPSRGPSALGAEPAEAAPFVWFGTYTGGPAGGAGIYVSRFDTDAGTLRPAVLATEVKNPSFLALHPTLPVLYSVSEVADADGKPMGAVLAFDIDASTGTLAVKNHRPSGGRGPCHVSVDRTGRVLLAANYGSGSVICLGIAADGSLEPVVAGAAGGVIQHEGRGVNKSRQEGPHAHSIFPTADGRFAVSCDLGIDKVLIHALDVDRATLRPHGFATVAAGAGPRHFAFHPNGRFGYSVNELDRTVTAFAWDAAAGSLAPLDSLSTLPAAVGDTTGFSTAEIVAHPNGRFLYASNRGHDSIAIYTIDASTGRPAFVGVEPIRGKTPRNFTIDPSGRYLLAGGQGSNSVTVFAIDAETGTLRFTGHSLDVPSPVCIRFRSSSPRP